jgi:hypothetical protein
VADIALVRKDGPDIAIETGGLRRRRKADERSIHHGYREYKPNEAYPAVIPMSHHEFSDPKLTTPPGQNAITILVRSVSDRRIKIPESR